jgi:hypothetical protein
MGVDRSQVVEIASRYQRWVSVFDPLDGRQSRACAPTIHLGWPGDQHPLAQRMPLDQRGRDECVPRLRQIITRWVPQETETFGMEF